ncbi:radical SAM protein [Desulfocurvibacter africanus]|uniref:radical SAM protein n=1 Tax=Desulfocurvibacter africanus TaxID=873 RepID=UPI0009DBF610|nr:radical SAM protein [Desulfocurvibacter africanus]
MRPSRAVLNFTHKCAMSCDWCYVPFGTPPPTLVMVNRIISRIAELGFNSITIGGGDPFQYPFISDALRHANSSGLFVHVDTNGRNLRQSATNLSLIEEAVDLIGLPLEGSKSQIHGQMRNSPNHFDLVCRRVKWLSKLRDRLKINTVVSALNANNMLELGELMKIIAPARWSLYQYWPLGPAIRAATKHSINDSEFAECTSILTATTKNSNFTLEINNRESRRESYPIIHHDGKIFVHRAFPFSEFTSLGNIFDSNALHLINSTCSGERPQTISRYSTRKQNAMI